MPVESDTRSLPDENDAKQLVAWWNEAEMAMHAGQIPRARRFLRWILATNPDDEEAWLWLAQLASDPGQQLAYLRQAYAFHSNSRRTAIALREARSRQLESAVPALVPRRAMLHCLPDQRRSAHRDIRPEDGNGHLSVSVAGAVRRARFWFLLHIL